MNRLWNTVQQSMQNLSERIGLRGLTLANEDGLVIASCGSGTFAVAEAEIMAAVSPLSNDHNEILSRYQEKLHEQGLDMKVFDVRRDGHTLFLCATGGNSEIQDPALPQMLEDIASELMPAA